MKILKKFEKNWKKVKNLKKVKFLKNFEKFTYLDTFGPVCTCFDTFAHVSARFGSFLLVWTLILQKILNRKKSECDFVVDAF